MICYMNHVWISYIPLVYYVYFVAQSLAMFDPFVMPKMYGKHHKVDPAISPIVDPGHQGRGSSSRGPGEWQVPFLWQSMGVSKNRGYPKMDGL